jgi:NADPH:quinone reductase-like Zn-dependent oxidoreductase
MRAVRFSRFGAGAEVAEWVEVAEPEPPAADEISVAVEVAAINPSDLLRFDGRYGRDAAALPADAGSSALGRVLAVGPGVPGVAVGASVLLHSYFIGQAMWRERLTVRAADVFALPPGDPRQLAMLSGNPPSAWRMLTAYVALEPGDWVLQNAANSAVGHYVIQLARHLRLRCLNVVRRADAVTALQAAGADAVVVDSEDLAAQVAAITGPQAPKLALDAIAGDATRRLAASVAPGGTVVNYGLLSGEPCRVEPHDTVFRDVSLRGFWLQAWWMQASREEVTALYQHLAAMVVEGTLHAPVEACYPLAQVREALAHAARPGRRGKILLAAGDG